MITQAMQMGSIGAARIQGSIIKSSQDLPKLDDRVALACRMHAGCISSYDTAAQCVIAPKQKLTGIHPSSLQHIINYRTSFTHCHPKKNSARFPTEASYITHT